MDNNLTIDDNLILISELYLIKIINNYLNP